jgi:hypothetical protein
MALATRRGPLANQRNGALWSSFENFAISWKQAYNPLSSFHSPA